MKKRNLKIDILCNDGSPLGVHLSDVYAYNGRVGVGGAELALLTMAEAWGNAGYHVRIYNNPTHMDENAPFLQHPVDTFIPHEDRDILIIFRSPNHRIKHATGKKIWWSTDQYTVGDFSLFQAKVDKIVTISPFHSQHFRDKYGIHQTTIIDLPVRIGDYSNLPNVIKIKNRMIYCSVPDRGLDILAQAYPIIKSAVPDASLVITSDYRLWGMSDARNEKHIRRFLGMDGVRFLGAVPRMELVQEQMLADIQAYPSTYDELFCYAVAECQIAGAYPVTSCQGAISTTNMGTLVTGDSRNPQWVPSYANAVIETLVNPELPAMQERLIRQSLERFSLDKVMEKWDSLFYE